MNKFILLLSILFSSLFCSCGSRDNSNQNEEVSATSDVHEYNVYTNYDDSSKTCDNFGNGTHSGGNVAPQTTRSQAFQNAFNSGKQIGYSDGMNGVSDGCTYASAYTDDWIKQAFLQGYEMGQAEAVSKGGSGASYYMEEEEYDGDEEYYYDDEY